MKFSNVVGSAIALALVTTLLAPASRAEEKKLAFRAGRDGDSLRIYVLSQKQLRPGSHNGVANSLYVVETEEQSSFYSGSRRLNQKPGEPRQTTRRVMNWIQCSTQKPYVAYEISRRTQLISVRFLNPGGTTSGYQGYHALYWSICHNLWEDRDLERSAETAQQLGYSLKLKETNQEILKAVFLKHWVSSK